MSIGLEDFEKTGKMTLSDFDTPPRGVKLGNKSASQNAALSVVLDEEPTPEKYRAVKERLLSTEDREKFILDQQIRRDRSRENLKNELNSVMVDPSVDVEQKKAYLDSFRRLEENTDRTIDTVAEQAITADSSPEETEEGHISRVNAIDSIREVNDLKRQQQAMINAYRLSREQGVVDKVVDFAEIIAPFAEWVNINQLSKELVPGDTDRGVLMGTQKNKLFNQIKNIPIDQRAAFTEMLIDLIDDNNNILLPDGNDIIAMDNLEKMVGTQDYSNVEKWFDNAVSILDIVGVGSILKAAVKGTKITQSASRIVDAASNTATKPTLQPGAVIQSGSETFTVDRLSGKAGDYVDTNGFRRTLGSKDVISQSTPSVVAPEIIAKIVRTEVEPTSHSQVLKDTNPEQARRVHTVVAADETGEAAEALYGTTRTEAVAKDLLPEPEIKSGTVENKVKLDGPEYEEPLAIRDLRNRDGNSYLTEAEHLAARNRVVTGLENVEGMIPHKESMSIKLNDDGSTNFRMLYHPTDNGFQNAERAMQNAKFAFRHYGLDDSNFVLHRRVGSEWIETSQPELSALAEVRQGFADRKRKLPSHLKEIDYAVGINYNWRFSAQDLAIEDVLSVKRNYLDRISPGLLVKSGQGSLTQNLLDAASVLHPQIVEPASVAVDKGVRLKKLYVDQFDGFVKSYNKMKKDRKAVMTDYINEANFKGLKLDETNLYARGFNKTEIETLKEWRRANDTMWYAANEDLVKSMRNKGFQIFQTADDTNLVVKPVGRTNVSSRTEFYDATQDTLTRFSTEELDNLYGNGGRIVKLHEPAQINDEWVEYVLARETPEGGYTRAMRDNEVLLNYRDGYYPVMYDANFFIDKVVTLASGEKVVKTVASAKNSDDSNRLLAGLRATADQTEEYVVRPDRRSESKASISEQGFAVGTSAGLSAQKIRGQRLIDAGSDLHKAGSTNLHDPLEAVATQISQLSERVSMRNYLDTVKERWIQSYSKALGLDKNKFGERTYPSSIDMIKTSPETDKKLVADARTMYNYISSLENGYINGIDEGYKALMHLGADALSGAKFKGAEEALRAGSEISPTSRSKGAVFKMFLAANPARQAIIQAHQAVQLSAINPTYLLGGLQNDMFQIAKISFGLKADKKYQKLHDEIVKSGIIEAVDANNLVRQDMLRLADTTVAQKIGTAGNLPLKVAQRIGFDAAEQVVLITSWLTHHNMVNKTNKTLTARQYEEIAGKSRAFTYNMNRAGDMPYNRNTLNIVAQFLQVPHKAFLQPLTNRSLTRMQRGQLLAWNTTMYGVPVGTLGYLYDNMEPGIERDLLEHGLEDVLLNATLSAASGEGQQVDFSDLAPSDLHGMGDFITSLATTDIGGMLANSPAGSLFFGANPRLTNMFKTTARYFHVIDDYDNPENQTQYTDVVSAAANLFSGWSNGAKARYAFKTGKKLSSMGNVTDHDVTKAEAALQFFGFQTKTETGTRRVNELIYGGTEFNPDDVTIWYNELKKHLKRNNMTAQERDFSQRVLSEAFLAFEEHETKTRQQILRMVQRDVEKDDFTIFEKIMKQMGVKTSSEVREMINSMPESEFRTHLSEQLKALDEAVERSRQSVERRNK